MKYNLFFALIYDILWRICEDKPSMRQNKLVKMALDYCWHDWVAWGTEVAMADVDRQVEEIQEKWAKDDPKPELIEHEPDGSKAQELLGGAMEIKSPWSLPEDK